MKVAELFEAKSVDQMSPNEIVKKLSHEEFIKHILGRLKNALEYDNAPKLYVNNLLLAAKKAGKNYPELEVIRRSITGGTGKMTSYDEKKQVHKGTSREWMDDNDITPEMIHTAIEKVKKTNAFDAVLRTGLKYEPAPAKEKNGNLTFTMSRLHREYPVSSDSFDKIIEYQRTHKSYPGEIKLKSTSPADIEKYILQYLKHGDAGNAQRYLSLAKKKKIDLPNMAAIQRSLDDEQSVSHTYQVSVNGQVWSGKTAQGMMNQLLARLKSPHVPVEGDKIEALVKIYDAALMNLASHAEKDKARDGKVRST